MYRSATPPEHASWIMSKIRFALYRETPYTKFESVILFKAVQMAYNPSRRALVSGNTGSDFWPQVPLSLVKASGTSTAWVPSS